MKKILALFRFRKPLLDSSVFELTFPEQDRKPALKQEDMIMQARTSLIKLSTNSLERIKELDTDSAEYDAELNLLTGYIDLKQRLDRLTNPQEHAHG